MIIVRVYIVEVANYNWFIALSHFTYVLDGSGFIGGIHTIYADVSKRIFL